MSRCSSVSDILKRRKPKIIFWSQLLQVTYLGIKWREMLQKQFHQIYLCVFRFQDDIPYCKQFQVLVNPNTLYKYSSHLLQACYLFLKWRNMSLKQFQQIHLFVFHHSDNIPYCKQFQLLVHYESPNEKSCNYVFWKVYSGKQKRT